MIKKLLLILFIGLSLGQGQNISVFDFMKNGIRSNDSRIEKDYTSEIEKQFQKYIQTLNKKSSVDISNFFHFDRYIWNSGPVFHFGNNPPVVFNSPKELDFFFKNWKQLPKNFENITKVENIVIAPVSGGDKAKVYLLDATLARLNKDRKIIKKNRNVYYFQTNRNYGLKSIFKKWKPWKIYLVSEVKIEA